MEIIAAKGIPIVVVSAKKEYDWILRGIKPFGSVETMQKQMLPFTGMITDDSSITWSTNRYHIPHYLVYGGGDINGFGWPQSGIYLFVDRGDGCYVDPKFLMEI